MHFPRELSRTFGHVSQKTNNLWGVFHSKEGAMCARRKRSSQINVHVTRDTGGTRAHGKHAVFMSNVALIVRPYSCITNPLCFLALVLMKQTNKQTNMHEGGGWRRERDWAVADAD